MVGAVEVQGHDLNTLRPTEFVNDTIMDYYSKRICDLYTKRWLAHGSTIAALHFFNSFFFKKLTERSKDVLGQEVCPSACLLLHKASYQEHMIYKMVFTCILCC
jgi:hypothetical protein